MQSFERIICENRIQDLQPSLASAVKSISRWHLIQSSVPYILQCCSKLLANRYRSGNLERLGNAERELLYTLHWILLEAPLVCCVVDTESLLYPLTIIEQFVHGLVPHVYSLRENDLTFRLENGIAIWGPLWKHEKPQLTPFNTGVIKKDTESEDEVPKLSSSFNQAGDESDFSAATFFDLAVLKCLFSTGWAEDGVVWALRYITEYLKKEFNLPEEAIQEGNPKEIPFHSSASLSQVQSRDDTKNLSTSAENLNLDGEPPKIFEGKDNNSKESAAFGLRDQEDHKYNEGLLNQPQVPREALEMSPGPDEVKGAASGLERAGSIRLRIRVGSSPVLRGGGRVLTAVASQTGSSSLHEASDKEHCIEDSDAESLQSPKVFIKASPTFQLPALGFSKDEERQSVDGTRPLQNSAFNSAGMDISCSEMRCVIADPQNSKMRKQVGHSINGPMQSSVQDPNSSSVAFQSIVSHESEGNFCTGRVVPEAVNAVSQLSDIPVFQNVSVGQTSSLASSSSAESENQPLLNSETAAQSKETLIMDTPRASLTVNQDSFIRIDRYFVFPGAADYITTDGRLSIMMILQALHSILRDNPTSCICDTTLPILFQIVNIHEMNEIRKSTSSFEYDDRTVGETQAVGFRSPHSENVLGRLRASFYGRPPSFLTLSVGCLVSLIKALGCPLGKNDLLFLTLLSLLDVF